MQQNTKNHVLVIRCISILPFLTFLSIYPAFSRHVRSASRSNNFSIRPSDLLVVKTAPSDSLLPSPVSTPTNPMSPSKRKCLLLNCTKDHLLTSVRRTGEAAHECVSEEALIHLKSYKYSSVDKSFISNYILKHYVHLPISTIMP